MGFKIEGPEIAGCGAILSQSACSFLELLHQNFEGRRSALLEQRLLQRRRLRAGGTLDFIVADPLPTDPNWVVALVPDDLQDRRVEITGPVDRKMIINALNSAARCFMADFEDSSSPTWSNMIEGQQNLYDAARGTIEHHADGKSYRLKNDQRLATLLVRPRGWHLPERHFLVNSVAMSASLFDFGLFFFHNTKTLIAKGSGPYFYLPKLESHLEARLWNDVFNFAQDFLQIPRGTIKATVLVETVPAAFAMEAILYELRDHSAGLNAGRWDYIFSMIKLFGDRKSCVLPDRQQITMAVPFMQSYAQLIVKICHQRGAHAMGGMSAFIPSRNDESINRKAFEQVQADKRREAVAGFDGTWVAHPGLIAVAQKEFDQVLGNLPNQLCKQRPDVAGDSARLLDVTIPNAAITKKGVQTNCAVALEYLSFWVQGVGAVAIHNLMEDAATAEISRTQLWQWLKHQVRLEDGATLTPALYAEICDEQMALLRKQELHRLDDARAILDRLVLDAELADFLTLESYHYLD